jgi:hypothetical protein
MRRTAVRSVLLLAASMAASWIYFPLLPLSPTTVDALVWLQWTAQLANGTFDALGIQHFVGYRPVALLSYYVDYLIAGLSPWIYRLTDLILHLAAAGMVVVLFRVLVPNARRWIAWIVAGVFLAHPLSLEVVPDIARRSYSLVTVIGLLGLAMLAKLTERHGKWPLLFSWIPGLLLGVAVLTHEAAVLLVPVGIALTLLRVWTHRVSLRVALPAWLLAGAAIGSVLLLRWQVLGGAGGYKEMALEVSRFGRALRSLWVALEPGLLDVAVAPVASHLAITALLILLAAGLWQGLVVITRRGDRDAAAANMVMVFWLGCGSVLFASLGVFFPRQAYLLLPPLAISTGVLVDGLFRKEYLRKVTGWLRLIPATALLVLLACFSPLFHGTDAAWELWRHRHQSFNRLHAAVAGVQEPATVWLVVPHWAPLKRQRPLRQQVAPGLDIRTAYLVEWARLHLRDRHVELRPWVFYDGRLDDPERRPRHRREQGHAAFILPAGETYLAPQDPGNQRFRKWTPAEEKVLECHDLACPGNTSCYAYLDDGSAGRLDPIGVSGRHGG